MGWRVGFLTQRRRAAKAQRERKGVEMTENEIARDVVDGLMNKRLGLVINFNEELIKTGIARVVNGLPEDQQ
jgi:hypothetical protein